MSEFKPKTEPDLALLINQKTLEFYNNCANVYDGYRNGANMILTNYYAPLLQAYTTTRAELESVKAELAKAKRTVSDLHVGIKEILYNLEDAKQDLKEANKYMLEAAKLNP